MIKFINVNKIYNNQQHSLKDVNMSIKQGEFVFITGHSGAGKSTIIKLLTKEEKLTNGTIIVFDEDINDITDKKTHLYRRNLGIVFQDFKLLKDKTVFENVELALRVVGTPSSEITYKVINMLKKVGLSDKYNRYPEELSGGECQRVCIARAIVNKPKIILADECTGNLDKGNSIEIVRLLKKISDEENITVLMTTHDTEILKLFKQREIHLNNGEIISDIYKFF